MIRITKIVTSLLLLLGAYMPLQAGNDNSNSGEINLELKGKDVNPTPLRAPMHLNLSANYDMMTGIITISYIGEAEGTVDLYLDGALFAVSSEINSIFHVSESGCYYLVIQTDCWVAQGYIQL